MTLTVAPVNDPPTAQPNTYTATEDRTLSVPAGSGLLANDTDPDTGADAHRDPRDGPGARHPALNPDGSFTYVPNANYNGVDTFTYQVSDGTATSAPVTVTLNVSDDAALTPGAGRDTGGTRIVIDGTGFGPAGTPVTVTIGGVPALDPEVLDDGHITFVTPPLPPNTPVDVVYTVGANPPETLPGAYLPMPAPAPGSPTDTDGDGITDEIQLEVRPRPDQPGRRQRGSRPRRRAVGHRDCQRHAPDGAVAPLLRRGHQQQPVQHRDSRSPTRRRRRCRCR